MMDGAQAPKEILYPYVFIWDIENLSLCGHRTGEPITSPTFVVKRLCSSKWHIKLYPKGVNEDAKDFLSLYLCRENDKHDETFLINYKIVVYDAKGKYLESMSGENITFEKETTKGVSRLSKNIYDLENVLFWKKDTLTIRCEIFNKHFAKDFPIMRGCTSKSKIEINKCLFEWNIKFPSSPMWKITETLYILPVTFHIVISAPEDEFAINIVTDNRMLPESRISMCGISLTEADGKKYLTKYDVHVFENTGDLESWKFPSFFTKSMILLQESKLLKNDTFTLSGSFTITTGTMTSSIVNIAIHLLNAIQFTIPSGTLNMHSALHADLSSMFISRKHCDVKLRVEETTFPAHRAILAARSPVFATMFDNDMKETKNGVVDVKDVKQHTMHSLLKCIYTGSIEELDYESMMELLIAADRYQVSSLIENCSAFLTSILTVENVFKVLVTADAIAYKPLKTNALAFIMSNFVKLMNSEIWPVFLDSNSRLATEVLQKQSDVLLKMASIEIE